MVTLDTLAVGTRMKKVRRRVLAVGVEERTCFKLVFSGDGPWEYDVKGFVEY
jgi:hypothetical protein